jgi:serine/threonine-protein kinase
VITVGDSAIAVRLAETVHEHPLLHCHNCGVLAPEDLLNGLHPGPWLCPACEVQRQQFPKTHADYLIEKRLGSGGMGEVFLAHQISTNRPVAIKMMDSKGPTPKKAKDYFRREMLVLKDLLSPSGQSHPNIVAFYDIFEIDGQFQLVMEYVPGKNAHEWLNGLGTPLAVPSVARIGRLLLSALEYAHAKGHVHRDVKPSNLLIWGPIQRPKLKLSDFGLAKNFRENAGPDTLTREGDVGGSVGFISPDHIRDFRGVKEPGDIYSVGATLYFLLTKNYPYLNFDPSTVEAYTMILENPPVPLRAHRPDAPEGLERVLAKALQKQPHDRWKSARAMSSALRPFCDDSVDSAAVRA